MKKAIRVIAIAMCLALAIGPFALSTSSDAGRPATLRQGNISVTGQFPNSVKLTAEEVEDPFTATEDPGHPGNPWWEWLYGWLSGSISLREAAEGVMAQRQASEQTEQTPEQTSEQTPAQTEQASEQTPEDEDTGSTQVFDPETFGALAYYDISLKNHGKEYHPDDPVTITISDVAVPQEGTLQVIHVLDDADIIEEEYFAGRATELNDPVFAAAFPEASEAAFRATGHKNVVFVEYCTAADGTLVVTGDTVSFVSRSFSVFILTETVLESSIKATDGNTYRVSVAFDVRANIPVDAQLEVTEITEDTAEYARYRAAAAEKMGYDSDSIEYLRLLDISIVSSRTHEEYQPAFPVDVSIELLDRAQDSAAALRVVHFGDEPELIAAEVKDGAVSFTTDRFSVYSLGEGVYRDTYKFFVPTDGTQTTYTEYTLYMEQGQTTFTQIVKSGEELVVPRLPSIADSDNSTFDAWYIGTPNGSGGATLQSTPFDFDNIPTPTGVEIDLYARFSTFAYVIFHEQYSGAADTWPITGTRRGELINGEATVHISDVTVAYDDSSNQQNLQPGETPPPPAKAFRGWTTEDYIDTATNTIPYNAPLQGDASGNVTIEENLELYPVFSDINWLSYSSAPSGSGATYFAPEFLYSDEGLSSLTGKIPTRTGYTFAGWYTAADGGVQVSYANGSLNTSAAFPAGSGLSIVGGQLMLDKNVTLYGHWTPGNASYTIVVWRQSVDDDKTTTRTAADRQAWYEAAVTAWLAENPGQTEKDCPIKLTDDPDPIKTYDFAASYSISSTSEATATVANTYKQYSGGDYTGFHYDRCDADATVQGNGSTLLNVYYDRNVVTYQFNRYGYTYTPNNSGTYGYVNGTYVQLANTTFYSLDGETPYTGTVYYVTTTTNNTTVYGIVNGQLVQLTRAGNTGNRYWTYNGQRYNGTIYTTNTGYASNTNNRYAFDSGTGTMIQLTSVTAMTYNNGNNVYTGQRYSRSNNQSWSPMLTMTGLYGQLITKYGYEWPVQYYWRENYSGTSASGTGMTYLEAFNSITDHPQMSYNSTTYTHTVNFYSSANNGTREIIHVMEDLDGNYSLDNAYTTNTSGSGQFNLTDKFAGYHVIGYRFSTFDDTPATYATAGESTPSSGNTLYVYHARNTHTLTFIDSYNNGAISTATVKYGAPLTGYQPASSPASSQTGYEFSGWYYDQPCSTRFDFTKTMPDANVSVYAGWSTQWYLIKINPNGGQLYGYGDYSTWFWKSYGTTELVVEYANTKREYIESLSGTWYYAVKDRDYYGLTDEWESREDTIHDRTTYYTQDAGDPAIVDLNVRYEYAHDAFRYANWFEVHGDGTETLYNFSTRIDHDLTLKLHWKQVGTYCIRYDAGDLGTIDGNDSNEVTFRLLDSADYMDRSEVVITRTAVANDEEHRNFIGWKIRGDNSNAIYYPGQSFEFQSRFATTQIVNGQERKYLVLDAVYTYIGTARIIYDANGGVVNSETVDYGAPTDPLEPPVQTNCGATTATIMNLINNSGITLADGTGFTRTDAEIVGWNTRADAQGTHFDLGGDYYVDTEEPMRLYAEWGVKVYFDKNNVNANWGGTWDPSTYTWDPVKEQYYTYAVIGRKVDQPPYTPVSSIAGEDFNYWTLERNSLDPAEYLFATQTVTGEMTLYGFWQLPVEIRLHAVDTTDATPVNKDANWLITNPSYVPISSDSAPLAIGSAAAAAGYTTGIPSTHEFAKTCVCATIDEIASAKPVSRIYYNSTERAVWVDYTDGTDGRVGDEDEIWFVYFTNPKTVNIRYKAMNLDGSLSNAVMNRTGYPATAQLNTYGMHENGHVNQAMWWANNEDYKYYAYAVGAPNATSSAQMRVITEASNSDANGSRPALTVENTWNGFRYSTDGGTTWTDCGRDIELYVIYYTTTAKPVVVTVNEHTVGRLIDLDEAFDYTVTVTETETNYTRTDTFLSYSATTPSSLGTPTVVGTPTVSTVSSSSFQLTNGDSSPVTIFYESTTPAYTSNTGTSRTCNYTVKTQTITVTQTAKAGFETVNDASALTPLVYTYTTDAGSVNQQVTFTNTRTPLEVEVHVAQLIGGNVVLVDDTLRKTTPADYTVSLPYDTPVSLTGTAPVDPFRGSTDQYVFAGIVYGTRTGTDVTPIGAVSTITYDSLTAHEYADIFLNGNESLLLGTKEIYYLYYRKPRVVYMEEEGDGSLTMINPVRYNNQVVQMNGVNVDQNLYLDVTGADFPIRQSGTGYRMPPVLDGSTKVLSLDYVKIGVGDASVTRTGDLEFVSENRELHLRIVDGTVQYSADGTTYTAFAGEPVVYAIYRDQANNTLKIIRNDGAAEQDFWYTVTCPDTTTFYVCLPKGSSSVTIKGVAYGDYTVAEHTEWSWRYASEGTQTHVRVYNANDTRPAGAMVGYTEVTFTGNVNNTDWLNGYDSEVNRFGP